MATLERWVFALAAVLLISTPLPAAAQKSGTVLRVGFLSATPQPDYEDLFWQELLRLGRVSGKDFAIERRSANGNYEQLPKLAADLARLNVNVIVTAGTQASIAAKKATGTIPIVMIGVSDPVGSGLVASLAHPGGNVTGTSTVASEVPGKQLDLVRDLLPGVSRVAILWNPGNPVSQQQLRETKAAATKFRLALQVFEARTPEDLDRAVAAAGKERAEALVVLPDPMFVAHARRIVDLATKQRLPVVSGVGAFAEAGAIATYGADYSSAYRRAATFVDRILKAAKPADLAVEQPAKFELAINSKAARTLGVTVPRTLIARADRVIR